MAEAAVVEKPETPPAAAPAAAPATPATVVNEPAKDTKGYWPEDWHTRVAGEDAEELKQVKRYASPVDIWKKARSLEKRLSSGELKAALPKDPKPADLVAWRKDNGIPESADKYDLKDVTIPKEDAELIKGFLTNAHGANFTPDQAKLAISGFYSILNAQEEAMGAKDEEQRSEAIDALAGEWGGKFSGYKNRIENFTNMFPEAIRESLLSARLPDGTALFNSVDFLKGVVAMSLREIPDGVNVPAEGGDIGKTALDEYNALRKLMREDRKSYDNDPAKQARFGDLIDYLTKHELIDGQGNEIVKRKKAA